MIQSTCKAPSAFSSAVALTVPVHSKIVWDIETQLLKCFFIVQRNVRFTEWFKFEPMAEFHRVVLAEDFLEYLAPTHWPPGKRLGFCWKPPMSPEKDCKMKEGSQNTTIFLYLLLISGLCKYYPKYTLVFKQASSLIIYWIYLKEIDLELWLRCLLTAKHCTLIVRLQLQWKSRDYSLTCRKSFCLVLEWPWSRFRWEHRLWVVVLWVGYGQVAESVSLASLSSFSAFVLICW